jgi:hypothetical protein
MRDGRLQQRARNRTEKDRDHGQQGSERIHPQHRWVGVVQGIGQDKTPSPAVWDLTEVA